MHFNSNITRYSFFCYPRSHFLSEMLTLGQPLWHSYNQTQLLFILPLLCCFPVHRSLPKCPVGPRGSWGRIFKAIVVIYRFMYRLKFIVFHITLPLPAENPSERAAGTAESWGSTPGKPLWHGYDQRLCRKGIVALCCLWGKIVRAVQWLVMVNWFILFDLKVADHWQQLMLKMEDRLKLVNASVAFYKTSEQVLLFVHVNAYECGSGCHQSNIWS